jgi:uncharacterized protein (TIGR02302 family)
MRRPWNKPPRRQSDGTEAPKAAELMIEVPEGSVLTTIVLGGAGKAVLDIDGEKTPLEDVDRVNRRLQQPLGKGGRLSVVHDGKVLGSWPLRTRADTPPQIAFDGEPAATQRGTLRMAYTGSDDYGITEIRGEMRRTYERGEVLGKEVSRFDLLAPSLNAKNVKEAIFQEIASHPWAGLPVVIRLAARDAAGQEGLSTEINLVLPERKFNNPVAKEIIVERRRLTVQPERRSEISYRINEIAGDTQAYKDDTVVFLGLVLSRSRLFHEEQGSAIPPVQELLWDTALRVEDGQLSHAERELARAQDALMKALARNAPDAELERLMKDLQNAMNKFMREMAKKLQNIPQCRQGHAVRSDGTDHAVLRHSAHDGADQKTDEGRFARCGAPDAVATAEYNGKPAQCTGHAEQPERPARQPGDASASGNDSPPERTDGQNVPSVAGA